MFKGKTCYEKVKSVWKGEKEKEREEERDREWGVREEKRGVCLILSK